MKKIICILGAAFCFGMIFTGFSPSVDGRAVIAEKNELPAGLFGKTVGYLPGDSVSVVNPTNGNSVDILVLGSLDPSEGVAILLSQEAAEQLKIEKNANNLVKLTKRTGGLDEQVYGTATIAQGSNESIADEIEDVVEQEIEVTPVEIVEDIPTEEILEENAEESPVIAENPVETEILESVEQTEKPVEIANAPEAEPEFVDEMSVGIAEETEPKKIDEGEESVLVFIPAEEEEISSAKEERVIIDETPSIAEVLDETELEEVAIFNEPEVEMIAPEIVETEKVDLEEPPAELNEEYAPIVLVPSEANPPVTEENNFVEQKEPVVPEVESVTVVEEEKPDSAKPIYSGYDSYIVERLSDLEKGKYYVQISVLSDNANIQNIIDKYKTNYPLVLVPSANGNTKQMMVGPLEMDEYGSVLEKFRANGFKDAFLRRIK